MHLKELPKKIVVALEPHRISFDFIIQHGESTFFIEFHEEQHIRLSVDRLSSVYDTSGREYRVPRFVQRLIRDVWRIKCFPDFTIVWYDWFAQNRETYVPKLDRGFVEYHLPQAFSFRSFLEAG